MNRNTAAGKCVHCLKTFDRLTWDHVFPKSWYPDTTPENLNKWKVPSCRECNGELGTIEEEFFRLVGLCLDPDTPATQGIVPKVLRSMRAAEKNSEKENIIRESIRQKVLKKAMEGTKIPLEGIIPGLHEKWGRPIGEQVAFAVPAQSVHRITEKIVRGICYIEDQSYIEPPAKIEFFMFSPDDATAIQEMFGAKEEVFSCGPGIVVRKTVAPEDGITSFFVIEFWGQFKTYASVTYD